MVMPVSTEQYWINAQENCKMVEAAVLESDVSIEQTCQEREDNTMPMINVLLVANSDPAMEALCADLVELRYNCALLPYRNALFEIVNDYLIEILIVDIETLSVNLIDGMLIARKLKTDLEIPVIVLVPDTCLGKFDVAVGIDDFLVKPCHSNELDVRIRQVLWKRRDITDEKLIKHGDLVMDMDKYEVTVDGKLIPLSYKEYELLKVLVTNKDKVLTREALLDKVWGYDYFGGDRTVDVHIRRLRSKIEDPDHSFIETINTIFTFKI